MISTPRRWMFEVVFDYGEGHYREDAPDEDGRVLSQAHRSGTATGRCARPVLHLPLRLRGPHLPAVPPGADVPSLPRRAGRRTYLVRSTAFAYRRKADRLASLTRVVQSGHRRRQDGRYLTRSLPPLDLFYTAKPARRPISTVTRSTKSIRASLANLPAGIDGTDYRWLDLDGEGICRCPDRAGRCVVLQAQSRRRPVRAPSRPSRPGRRSRRSSGGRQQLHGSGRRRPSRSGRSRRRRSPGFYERTLDSGWAGFARSARCPCRIGPIPICASSI